MLENEWFFSRTIWESKWAAGSSYSINVYIYHCHNAITRTSRSNGIWPFRNVALHVFKDCMFKSWLHVVFRRGEIVVFIMRLFVTARQQCWLRPVLHNLDNEKEWPVPDMCSNGRCLSTARNRSLKEWPFLAKERTNDPYAHVNVCFTRFQKSAKRKKCT